MVDLCRDGTDGVWDGSLWALELGYLLVLTAAMSGNCEPEFCGSNWSRARYGDDQMHDYEAVMKNGRPPNGIIVLSIIHFDRIYTP